MSELEPPGGPGDPFVQSVAAHSAPTLLATQPRRELPSTVVWAYGGTAGIAVLILGIVLLRPNAPFSEQPARGPEGAGIALPSAPEASGTVIAKIPGAPPKTAASPTPPPLPGAEVRAARADLADQMRRGELSGALGTLELLAEKHPEALEDDEVRQAVVRLSQFVGNRQHPQAERFYTLLTSRMGTKGLDLLYYFVTAKGGSDASRVGREILLDQGVRDRATPELRVAWDLRETKGCAEKKKLFQRAGLEGDSRALTQLQLLAIPCGRRNRGGCCLDKDPELKAATAAIEARLAR